MKHSCFHKAHISNQIQGYSVAVDIHAGPMVLRVINVYGHHNAATHSQHLPDIFFHWVTDHYPWRF